MSDTQSTEHKVFTAATNDAERPRRTAPRQTNPNRAPDILQTGKTSAKESSSVLRLAPMRQSKPSRGLILVTVVAMIVFAAVLTISYMPLPAWTQLLGYFVVVVALPWYVWTESRDQLVPTHPPPTKWWPAWVWLIMRILRINRVVSWVPPRTLVEMEILLDKQIFQLGQRLSLMLSVLNTKGGSGKTPSSTLMGATIASKTHASTVVIDVNENEGDMTDLFGIEKGSTLQWADYLEDPYRFDNHRGITLQALQHEGSGAYAIASEFKRPQAPGVDRLEPGFDAMRGYFRFVVNDCGNGHAYAGQLVPVTNADVLVFVATVHKPSSLKRLRSNLAKYAEIDLGSKEKNARFQRKLERCTILLLGIKSKEVAWYAKEYDLPEDRLFAVPSDSYMEDTTNIVAEHKLRRRTRVAIKLAIVSILQDGKDLTSDDSTDRDHYTPEDEEPHGLSQLQTGEEIEELFADSTHATS